MNCKIKYFIKKISISIILMICFFCYGCNGKYIDILNNDNIDKEIVLDENAVIKANEYNELMRIYGSIYIKNICYDKNNKMINVIDIYDDEHNNIAYREYFGSDVDELNNKYYDVKINDKWYISNENGLVGERYDLLGDEKKSLEENNIIQKYNGKNFFIDESEKMVEHYIDENGSGILKTSSADIKNKLSDKIYEKCIKEIPLNEIVKVITTYVYDIDTKAISNIQVDGVDKKGVIYKISYAEINLGGGMLPIMKNVENNVDKIKTYEELVKYNNYDRIIKKYNSVSVNTKLQNDFNKNILYEAYGDFRGIISYKLWDNTYDKLYDKTYRHIKDAKGNWYKSIDDVVLEEDDVILGSEKSYYENNTPIFSVFGNESIILKKELAYNNYIDGKNGHIICKFDKLSEMYVGYNKTIIDDLDLSISEINVDYEYDLQNYFVNNVKVSVIKKDKVIDDKMIYVNINYGVDSPKYAEVLFYDKNFIFDYYELFEKNTEKSLLDKNKAIRIIDTRYLKDEVLDKSVILYKSNDGTFSIKDNDNIEYVKYKNGNITKIENGVKQSITDFENLDIYITKSFEKNNIIKAFYNKDDKESLINDDEKIVVCYSNLREGTLITTNEEENIRVEYTFDLNSKMIYEIKYYSIEKNNQVLKYMTRIEKADNIR